MTGLVGLVDFSRDSLLQVLSLVFVKGHIINVFQEHSRAFSWIHFLVLHVWK